MDVIEMQKEKENIFKIIIFKKIIWYEVFKESS